MEKVKPIYDIVQVLIQKQRINVQTDNFAIYIDFVCKFAFIGCFIM